MDPKLEYYFRTSAYDIVIRHVKIVMNLHNKLQTQHREGKASMEEIDASFNAITVAENRLKEATDHWAYLSCRPATWETYDLVLAHVASYLTSKN